ncbi:MAG: bifunctional metallophosphatase/5'-nucleotidase [Clostridia bacterium]|nr:bifunctional metallophosphatase/5'-nucleotidase [Clostridia bacterium]
MNTRLTVYYTSDTHGYLYPTHFRDLQPHPMGLLSMRFPKDENTLVIDGGDTIQGSPLTYYCRISGVESPVAQALNDRGYDYVTLGNHDFNNGAAYLGRYLHALHARCLCANVRDAEGRLPLLPGTVHVLGNGLRVGLVGVVTDWVNRWEKKENLKGLTVSDPLEAARRSIAALPPHDVLIGIYHGGIEKDLSTGRTLSDTDENIACRLCEELPFDLLLTGHQHIALAEGHWRGTHIVQTPCNAEQYIKITLDEGGRFHSALESVPDQAELTEKEEKLLSDLNAWLDHPVGRLSQPLWPEDHLTMAMKGSPIADFFNLVQLDASGADVSCAALANSVRGFDSSVTVRDVVASYVYSNTLKVLEVTGEILRKALEQCASYFQADGKKRVRISPRFLEPKEAHYNYDYFAGVTYAFDLNRPVGSRVTELKRNGRNIAPDETLSLCMCDYRATGSGDFDFYRSCPCIKDIQTDVSELILNYLRAHPFVEIPAERAYRVIL